MGLWRSGWFLILLDQLSVGFSSLFVVPTKEVKNSKKQRTFK
jgi:hypothetical protein